MPALVGGFGNKCSNLFFKSNKIRKFNINSTSSNLLNKILLESKNNVLLNKNSKPLELNHDKWYRNLSESNIVVKDQIYNLIATENKRKLIYESKGIAINTKAIKI